MNKTHEIPFLTLLEALVGSRRRDQLLRLGAVPGLLASAAAGPGRVSRAEVAMALAAGLLDDLCARVPYAEAYLAEAEAEGRSFLFDHGAMRTVALPSGELPAGRAAIARILLPLGYVETRRYPLERLGMVGYVFTHAGFPEVLPQYFVSELEPQRFDAEFAATVARLVETSVDPLPTWARDHLVELQNQDALPVDQAVSLVRVLVTSFRRHHREPSLEEYETLAATSAEMAWIATEGHTFNHITDRVPDVVEVADRERRRGRPVKDEVEVSGSGRVIQTALRAADVDRLFSSEMGYSVRSVPGSFLEFISRDVLPRSEGEGLDLAFDAANAQGIFKMTDAGGEER